MRRKSVGQIINQTTEEKRLHKILAKPGSCCGQARSPRNLGLLRTVTPIQAVLIRSHSACNPRGRRRWLPRRPAPPYRPKAGTKGRPPGLRGSSLGCPQRSRPEPQSYPHPFNHLQPSPPNTPNPRPHNRIDRRGSPVSYRRSKLPVPLRHVTRCYTKDPLLWQPQHKPTPTGKTRRKAPDPAPLKAKPSPAATVWSMA